MRRHCAAGRRRRSSQAIDGGHLRARRSSPATVIVTLAYFFHITTFYFIVKWIPKIVVDMGFAASSAAGVLVWTNVGGALGGAVFGLLTQRFGVKPLTIGVLLLSTIVVATVRPRPGGPAAAVAHLRHCRLLHQLPASSACTRSSRRCFRRTCGPSAPASPSASGRGGSVLAPIIAGFLFAAGYSLPTVAMLMALGSLLAAFMLMLLKLEMDRPTTNDERARARSTPVPTPSPAR